MASALLPDPEALMNFRPMIEPTRFTPEIPAPLFPVPAMIPETCVPCPTSSMGSQANGAASADRFRHCKVGVLRGQCLDLHARCITEAHKNLTAHDILPLKGLRANGLCLRRNFEGGQRENQEEQRAKLFQKLHL